MRLKYFSLILLALLLFFISSASAMSLDDSSYGEFDSLVVDSGDTVVDDSMDVDLDDSDFEYSDSDDLNICVDDLDDDTKYTDKDSIVDDFYYSKDYKLSSDFDSSLFSSSVSSLGASKTSTVITASNLTMSYYDGHKLIATIKTSSGKAISGLKVTFTVNGVTYNRTSNASGKVVLGVKNGIPFAPGNYSCVIKFAGTSAYAASSKTVKITINKWGTKLVANNYSYDFGVNCKLVATLQNSSGKAISGKSINFTINGKSYSVKTNSSGKATLEVSGLDPGSYSCVIKYVGDKVNNTCSKTVTVTVNKWANKLVVDDVEVRPGTGRLVANLQLEKNIFNLIVQSCIVFDKNNETYCCVDVGGGKSAVILPNQEVIFNIANKSYVSTTDDQGNAFLDLSNLDPGNYSCTVEFNGAFYSSSCSKTVNVVVKKFDSNISFVKDNVTFVENFDYNSSALKIFLKDSKGNSIVNQVVSVSVFDGNSYFVIKDNFISSNHSSVKVYNLTTDGEGCVCLGFNLPSGSYNVSVSFMNNKMYNDCSNSLVIPVYYSVVHNYTLDEVISAAIVVKNYVNANNRLPDSVVVGDENCSVDVFVYLMGKAISNIYSSDFSDLSSYINYSYLNHPHFVCNDDLSSYSYSNVARNIVLFMDLYSYAPDAIGGIDFDCYAYTFAKILTFYNITGHLPLEINFNSNLSYEGDCYSVSRGNSSQFKDGCNEVNQVENVSKYLVNGSGSFCEVTSSITNIAKSLTNGLADDWDKAEALFKYVRDKIIYSFYYNSKGASVALANKEANDCDDSNLMVALFRASGFAARYCHGVNHFKSGLVTSHVWVQVLVDGIWYTADTSSTSNDLGNIQNWYVDLMNDFTQYDLLPF